MKLELESLRDRHPILQPEHTADLALHAAVALHRQRHASGVTLLVEMWSSQVANVSVHWDARPAHAEETLDAKRVTELGAETLALLLVHEALGWVVRRRLQEGDFADWLLRDRDGGLVALEVGGTREGDPAARMRSKVEQVAKCDEADTRAACVVRFSEPALWWQVTYGATT
jgi:hypothetical protein